MPDPINYSIDVPNPMQAFNAGLQTGSNVLQVQQQAQLLQQAQQQRQLQAQVLGRLVSNPNSGATDYANAMTMLPQLAEPLKKAWEVKSPEQSANTLRDLAQWSSAIQNGQPQIAVDSMNERADAMEKSGVPADQVQALRLQAQMVEAHPEFANGAFLKPAIFAHPEGGKLVDSIAKMGGEGRAAAEAPAELLRKNAEARIKAAQAGAEPLKLSTDIANVQSQITERSKRLGLDQDKLTSDVQIKLAEMAQKNGELPEYVATAVNTAATEAVAAQQSAARMTGLADQIDKAAGELSGGVEARTGELWKRTFGTQNELTRIRAEYSRIVTPAAMAAYKKVATGSTSDKDIETAMTGVPKDTDSPERMSQFLRGAAKLQVYDSVLNNAKTEWLGAVRNLGKAKADIEVDGVKVPAGTTFNAYADQIVGKKVADLIAAQAAQQISARSYMRFAQPAAAPALAPVTIAPGD